MALKFQRSDFVDNEPTGGSAFIDYFLCVFQDFRNKIKFTDFLPVSMSRFPNEFTHGLFLQIEKIIADVSAFLICRQTEKTPYRNPVSIEVCDESFEKGSLPGMDRTGEDENHDSKIGKNRNLVKTDEAFRLGIAACE